MINRSLARILLAFLACAAFAVEPPKPAEPPKITQELRAKFWRAQAEAIAVQAQVQRAQAALRNIQEALIKACDGRPVVAGKDGEPECGAKPPEKPETR